MIARAGSLETYLKALEVARAGDPVQLPDQPAVDAKADRERDRRSAENRGPGLIEIPIGTLLALCASAPGLAFVLSFVAMSRLRRQLRSDPILALSALVVGSVVAGLLSLIVMDWCGLRPSLAELIVVLAETTSTEADVRAQLSTAIHHAVNYLGLSIVVGALVGGVLSKLVVWGVIRSDFYHGSLYAFRSGFFRKQVFAKVLTNVHFATDQHVIYSGVLDDVQMSPSGRIEYVALKFPEKALYGVKHAISSSGLQVKGPGVLGQPETITPDRSGTTYGSLIVESEDIQNLFLFNRDLQPAPIKLCLVQNWGFVAVSGLVVAIIALGAAAS